MENSHLEPKFHAPAEQRRYAAVMRLVANVGLVLLLITFFLYVSGLLQPFVPLEKLPEYWSMDVSAYLHALGLKGGWEWLGMLRFGDFLTFAPVALLGGVTLVCYALLVPAFLAKRDFAYLGFVIAELVVLVLAASGILVIGH